MMEDLHIELIQMMENAGRNLAELGIRLFAPGRVVVLAGPGGNGGGGLVAARHLSNRGVRVNVVLSEAGRMMPVPQHQLDILTRMSVEIVPKPTHGDLVIDALIGYSLRGNPEGRTAQLIAWANEQPAPRLSLDTPSGLDLDSGEARSPCVDAAATMTVALPKRGLLDAAVVGDLYLADISVPRVVYERMGLEVPMLFSSGPLVRLAR